MRAKTLLITAALGALACALNLLHYRAGVRAVESALRADARAEAVLLAGRLEAELASAGGDYAHQTASALGDYARAVERRAADDGGAAARTGRQLIAVGGDGRVLFHANAALLFQPVERAMPYFEHVGREMAAGRAGAQFYDGPPEDARWLTAYEPVGGQRTSAVDRRTPAISERTPAADQLSAGVPLPAAGSQTYAASGQSTGAGGRVSVAAARNYTAAVAPLRGALAYGLAASVVGASVASFLVFVLVGRGARFVRAVADAASKVAGGDLEQRIDARTVGADSRSLADSFNLMTERLREHLRRESENRQFQAFVRLSATLTHDLKNAITGLSMLVSNMERQYHREEFRADAISSLRDATDKLRAIVARLSEPVRTLSGEYGRTLRPVDLSSLVGRVLEQTAAASFHEVETRLPASLEATVEAERIERVVENLVVNALEAMGARRGLLTVEAGREGERYVYLAVADTGPGMSEEFIRARLFRPFATTKSKGIGLGLYTCREVVEAHGGRIEVESKQGAGTRFRVVLPSALVAPPRPTTGEPKRK